MHIELGSQIMLRPFNPVVEASHRVHSIFYQSQVICETIPNMQVATASGNGGNSTIVGIVEEMEGWPVVCSNQNHLQCGEHVHKFVLCWGNRACHDIQSGVAISKHWCGTVCAVHPPPFLLIKINIY